MDKFYAGGFLYNPKQRAVFLHKRDGKTNINPNKWGIFGGLNEGTETFVECFARELHEEIGLKISKDQPKFLREYLNANRNTYRAVFYVESEISEDQLTLGEGAGFGWVPLDSLADFDLTDKTRDDIEYFISTVLSI